MQDAAGVDPGDRAAAGADAGDVEARQRHSFAGDAAARGEARPASLDKRDVGAGAAHVERHEIGGAAGIEEARRVDAAGDAPGWPRQHRPSGEPPSLADRHDAAMRLDDEDRPRIAGLRKPVPEPGQIARQRRADIGVDDRRRDALELLDLRQHLG
jgi:hypothetical protein